ncbi:[citrate (pro-3S)-lyase] ligase [Spiroplasma endosymbiont of Stenodema calcarata]|uniref:[citrate (pro-3S)-lyase] ligase n=1 Tax=Spiroplasma endosymbiont of Stenodema calcarata TaxID=3139328 RepID=UPI003CCB13B2
MDNIWRIHDIKLADKLTLNKIEKLLGSVNLKSDIIEECAVIYDESKNVIATVSRYLNTLKCLAIEPAYQGNNLANKLVTYMIQRIYDQGWNEVFVFTKPDYFSTFQSLGFNIIYQNHNFAFLTNRDDLFKNYLDYLAKEKTNYNNASVIVMNANPFTKGHLFLVQQASLKSDFVYIIPVKESGSLFTYQQRKTMIELGIQEFKNVKLLEGSNYLVSKNVFPSYFLSSPLAVIQEQTNLDVHIFVDYIAKALQIKTRFVGEEPYSLTTNEYNKTMKTVFMANDLNLIIIPRLSFNEKAISATTARKLFIQGDFDELQRIVPKTSADFLKKLDYLSYQKLSNIDDLINKDY